MAVSLNNLFNLKVKGYCKIYSPENVKSVPVIAKNIYKNMTPEDKNLSVGHMNLRNGLEKISIEC